MLALRGPTDLAGGSKDAAEAVGHVRIQPVPRIRERDGAMVSMEKARPDGRLEPADRLTHRRLGQPQFRGGAGERREARHRLEDHEVVHGADVPEKFSHNLNLY